MITSPFPSPAWVHFHTLKHMDRSPAHMLEAIRQTDDEPKKRDQMNFIDEKAYACVYRGPEDIKIRRAKKGEGGAVTICVNREYQIELSDLEALELASDLIIVLAAALRKHQRGEK